MTLSADIFWSFRSPYSYLAIPRYRAMVEEFDLTLNLRPVYPLAIRQPDFFARSHPNWFRYLFTDVARLSQYLGVPFVAPRPDPIVQNIATRQIAEDQPHIFRLTRMGQAAARLLLEAMARSRSGFSQVIVPARTVFHDSVAPAPTTTFPPRGEFRSKSVGALAAERVGG